MGQEHRSTTFPHASLHRTARHHTALPRTLLQLLLFMLFPAALLTSPGCGGGSVGTGTGEGVTTVEGKIVTPSGEPLAGAAVKLQGAAVPATTDANGHFVIAVASTALPTNVQLQVAPNPANTSTSTANVAVVEPSTDPSALVVQVVIDIETPPVVIQSSEVKVQAAGLCADRFVNNRTIEQIGSIVAGTLCTFNVSVTEDTVPQPLAQYRVEYRACDDASLWIPLLDGVTNSPNLGNTGEASFPYIEDADHCVYRVVAPVNQEGLEPTAFEIRTLLKKQFDQAPGPLTPTETPTELPTGTPTPVDTPAVTPTPDITATPTELPTPMPSEVPPSARWAPVNWPARSASIQLGRS